MKITCDRSGLLSAFQTAAAVAPSRSPKAILQNVKFVVTESTQTLIATDLELGVRIETPDVQVERPGAAILPVAKFGSILRECSAEKIHVETEGNLIYVKADRSQFRIAAYNADEFPDVLEFSESSYHVTSAKQLREMIHRTAYATDTESSRYALGGVLLEFTPERIYSVGTDGRRLAKMEGPGRSINDHGNQDTLTIVPTRSVQLLERALTDADGDIQISARNNDILFRSSRLTVYSRLVEGRFPRWREVLPARSDLPAVVLTVGPTYSAMRQAAIMASENSRGIDFTFGNGQIVLKSATPESGDAEVQIPIEFNREPVTVRLDNRYVLDFLRVLDLQKTFTIDLVDSQSAALFETDDGYSYVVMPLAREEDAA